MRKQTVQVRLSPSQVERVDAQRRAYADPPTRALEIQNLLDRAIEKFISDEVVERARSMPSLPPTRRGRPAKRISSREEAVSMQEGA